MAEVVFVVGANSPDSFDRARRILTSMIESPKGVTTNYGIVKYGKDSKIVAIPEDYQDNLELLDIVKDMDWQSEGVDILGAVDKARNIFRKSENSQALRRMVVVVDSLTNYNEMKDVSEDIEKDGIKLVIVVGDKAAEKDVTPDDGSTVIDDPDTDVGNTTSLINEEIHKGECMSFLERCRKWKRLLHANLFAGKFFQHFGWTFFTTNYI